MLSIMEDNLIVENSVVKLLTLLRDNSLNCNKTAEHIVKSISTFFGNEHSKSELDLAFSLLFRPENSLLYFIEKGFSNKSLTSGVKEALTLVLTLFDKFKDNLPQHILAIKEVCYKCVRDSNSADLQGRAYQIITAIVRSKVPLPPDADLNVSALVTFIFNQKLGCKKSLCPTVLGSIYELFGAIAQHYPANCSASTINSVLRNVLAELKNQLITAKDVKTPIIEGCMMALKGMLVHFTRDYNEDPENSKEIYSYVQKVCAFQENTHRKTFQRAALEVLTVHLDQMWKWALEDYRWWLKELPIWAGRQGQDKYTGIDALRAFHRRCWTHLTQCTESLADKEMARLLLDHYKQTFTDPCAAAYDLQLAVEGFGALASVASRLIEDHDQNFVTLMFRIILQRAQTDYTKSEDNNTEQLGRYLESLSNICRELKTINTDQLAALQQLTRLFMANYPHNNKRTQSMAVSALCTTILNMSLCEGQLLDRFLYPVIYQGILVTCGQCLAEEAELRREVTGQEVVTYQNFLSLWTGLFSLGYENRVKISGVTPSLRRHIFGKLHDCLIKSLIEILSKLDVEYQKQNTEELEMKADPESSLRGTKPEDHNILCNLANLYKDLLRAMDGEQLTRWLPELITTIINHSVQLPLVSGFYKLLAAVLGVADRTNYFQVCVSTAFVSFWS
ncbi:DNA-dependent protein kinase catalytic subunit-like [Homalodisca vitripennis]|uniref:DNA-dependent protein kinase catalytic subunit-like n=1 Tax=Homalodisca vitripennis TaxID=197043 RepID=UPI001EEB3A29|nr:DNA-dependent protein kinase catalytic subunit-like [Homalodisca vitripennis]